MEELRRLLQILARLNLKREEVDSWTWGYDNRGSHYVCCVGKRRRQCTICSLVVTRFGHYGAQSCRDGGLVGLGQYGVSGIKGIE
ncbi:hypothetical protein PIB30_052498 [Stylosanthes scabra]|uniref:Uncharacterized protein n=1 Tax=Stylosanthes scabra TaxID=79078 RepID=A0ABU6UI39_9FABA|nr:hypothetical protein [Stylosanthes scabra]